MPHAYNVVSDTLSVAATEEPVTLAEVKRQLRLQGAGFDSTDFDLELQEHIRAATEEVEDGEWVSLVTQTRIAKLDWFPDEIRLPRTPVQSVSSITYVDFEGTTQTLSSSLYTVDTAKKPARIVPAYNQTWPQTRQHIQVVTVTYVAGFGAASAVPKKFKDAIKLIVQQKFEGHDESRQRTIERLLALDTYRSFV